MSKDNGKDFTPAEKREALIWTGAKCEKCTAAKTGRFWSALEFHHKKRRSALKKDEGSGGVANCAVLCVQCHRDLHDGQPGFDAFKVASWESITKKVDSQ